MLKRRLEPVREERQLVRWKADECPSCYALISGGKDSLSTAAWLAEHGKLIACVALETGVSTPDWKDFVVRVCEDRGWDIEFYATDESYEDLVQQYGFPGPGKHGLFMNYLKGRGIRKFRQAHPYAFLASGVRRNESQRRWISTQPISVWEGALILAPIWEWGTEQTWNYFWSCGFNRAPAYDYLTVSGDCLCGAFACEGEAAILRLAYPSCADRFHRLGEEIKDRHPTRCSWGWGAGEPRMKTGGQAAICVECGD